MNDLSIRESKYIVVQTNVTTILKENIGQNVDCKISMALPVKQLGKLYDRQLLNEYVHSVKMLLKL